ncbi:hypothetical protein FHS43_003548 [Streptosporangium becharense]|uniref:Uncharacterized protein n=1 Tax=Streptosporangium becharense TaxID=1816182 RepID=A0A7W9MFH8_9ACTN|nr:hypothetical protein [Streptosporangium becharense]MBB2912268.1 hypothetical protein [Streptosporangium becharense]MBB5818815.1 hypothetical protein [Streptosporangium becharense]
MDAPVAPLPAAGLSPGGPARLAGRSAAGLIAKSDHVRAVVVDSAAGVAE